MSYFESKKLREERFAVVTQMTDMAAEVKKSERAMSVDEMATWDNLDNAQKDLMSKIDTAERFLSLPKEEEAPVVKFAPELRSSAVSDYDCNQAVRGFLLRNAGENVPEECLRSANKLKLNINTSNMATSFRHQTVGTVADGGHSVLTGAFIGFEKAMLEYGGMDSFCRILNTSQGNPLPLLMADDTANVGVIRAELASTGNVNFALSRGVINSYRVSSAVFKVSKELLRDSEINISSYISEILAERLARKASGLYISGGGTTEPLGIEGQAVTSGVTLASSTTISYGELNAIYHSIDPSYRKNASWMFNDNCLSILKGVVDTTGRPLWVASLTQGAPDSLLGKPLHIVQEVKSIGTSNVKSMYFGDFSKVTIRKVGGVEIQTLNELYALDNAVGVVANFTTDILVTQTAAVKFVTSKTIA